MALCCGCLVLRCWDGAVPGCSGCGSLVGSPCSGFSLVLPPHQLCHRFLWPGCAQESEQTARGRDGLSLCCPWPHCSATATVSTGAGKGLRRCQDPCCSGKDKEGGGIYGLSRGGGCRRFPCGAGEGQHCVPRQLSVYHAECGQCLDLNGILRWWFKPDI